MIERDLKFDAIGASGREDHAIDHPRCLQRTFAPESPMSTHPSQPAYTPAQATQPVIRRDTRAWQLQVWLSFGIAISLCAIGLAWLPGQDLDRAFMVMGYVFCLSSAFVLAKFIRDKVGRSSDTPLWSTVVWGAFLLALSLTGWGLWRMEIQPIWKAYLLVSWLFLISTVFTLAKTLRDAHDADLMEARLAGRREARQAAAASAE
jgi:hypothetical protein